MGEVRPGDVKGTCWRPEGTPTIPEIGPGRREVGALGDRESVSWGSSGWRRHSGSLILQPPSGCIAMLGGAITECRPGRA